ncbi:hypothetical protein JWS04_30365 [Bradyrhizobium vignae]|uniref:CheB-type methylesterase domain-containing protein n=1 Tax=Bradyrhizobium vignae TaxID=1549949 RepID=A0ABS4A4F9_9BRAD|nr:hypothetical protein [Bradyrhizobium vignae]
MASAGGIPALIDIVRRLEPDFPFPIFVAQHLPRIPLSLDQTLSWHGRLPVRGALPPLPTPTKPTSLHIGHFVRLGRAELYARTWVC